MTDDNSTVLITDIHQALSTTDEEAKKKLACLVVVGGELNGTIFDLPEGIMTFGRNPDNTITLEFAGISRAHFQIQTKDINKLQAVCTIQDLGSSNGTFINNQQVIDPRILKKGDMIKVGTMAFKFIAKGDSERLAYDKLHEEANTDGLTKCFNKTYFNNASNLEVNKSKATGEPLSLIVFDLDHFKKLNDNFGHDAGDYVLKEIAQIIRLHGIRDRDVFARYGGEEFVILLPKTNLKQGFEIAERIRKIIENHDFRYENKKLPVTASIGVSDYRDGVDSGTELFKRADSAVYTSKNNGRNQVNFYKE